MPNRATAAIKENERYIDYCFYLGRKLVVVLGNFDVVKEALSNNKIMDRPKNPPNDLLPNSTSLSVSNGLIWKEQRHFSVQALREHGMAKSKMEDIIQIQLNMLMEEIDSKKGNPMNLDQLLLPTVSNVILTMLIGKPLDFKDKDRVFLNKMLQTMVVFFRPTRFHAYFPSLRYWMASLKIWGYDKAEYYMNKFEKFIVAQIEHHKKTFDNQNVQNYIDSYLLTLKTKIEKVSSFSEKMLKGNFQSFFSAGSTPSRATLEWCFMSMLRYPDVQKAIHEELDTVLGRDRRPTWDDHLDLPYTMSVIYEVMRQNTIVPISMLRCTSSRTKIAGYDIPEGTIVMTNIWGVHHDPKDWDDPFSFKPERFLMDGKAVKPQAFIPFSYGKRNCPGEDMAIIMVFLFLTTLMQRYSITLPDTDFDIKQVVGVAKLVILDNVCLKIRC
ncbi:cytochrome P450 2J6 [Trichonephila inaurata madagascariensis]|uniref:Cytochrome P450 2J6 n=1 Tax=Trichonephila inaurata madagascariensis TaxID=2747483 RepID=A0A8X6IYW1_9ARAC|nr:cytochrome P450 2J6 [Trichonephila inaurata madagascariensis]